MLGEGGEDLVELGPAALPLLREDHRIVRDDVVLALLALFGLGAVAVPAQVGGETRRPSVVAASDGAVEDANVRHGLTLAVG